MCDCGQVTHSHAAGLFICKVVLLMGKSPCAAVSAYKEMCDMLRTGFREHRYYMLVLQKDDRMY